MEKLPPTRSPAVRDPGLDWLERTVGVLDDRLRIPGTNIRFGLDAIIGLIPGLGDAVGFAFSGLLVAVMARRGASGMLAARMIGNIFLDAVIGAIPILGAIFDVAFRANRRNLRLLREHYEEGRHQGSAWWVVAVVIAALIGLLVLIVWLAVELVQWLVGLI